MSVYTNALALPFGDSQLVFGSSSYAHTFNVGASSGMVTVIVSE